MKKAKIFSIGHSTHSIDRFVDLLKQHRIDVVADVRSSPFSRFTAQFNKDDLADALRKVGIKYMFFGKELGIYAFFWKELGIPLKGNSSCHDVKGRVPLARLVAKPEFWHAISRLIKGAGDYRIALMCAEKEPLDCHRTILVSQALKDERCEVSHIHADGSLESHEAALERLLEIMGIPERDLVHSKDELVKEALSKQEKRIISKATGKAMEGARNGASKQWSEQGAWIRQ